MPWVIRNNKLVTKEEAREIDARQAKDKRSSKAATFKVRKVQRGSWVLVNGQLIPKGEYSRARALASDKRSDHAAPAFRTDTIEVRSMADGKMYDSRAKYYRSLEEKGLVIDDRKDPSPGTPYVDTTKYKKEALSDVVEAYNMVEQGYKPAPLKDARDQGFEVPKYVSGKPIEYVR